MSETTHTPRPLPWRIAATDCGFDANENPAFAALRNIDAVDDRVEVAAFILRAVNAHDALVKALEIVVKAADSITSKGEMVYIPTPDLDTVRSALALAKGEKG